MTRRFPGHARRLFVLDQMNPHVCSDYPLSSSLTSKAEEASSGVARLQSTLADDSSGQAASDSLSEEIAQLKAGVAAERVRFSHMTEALEATKGSAEEASARPLSTVMGQNQIPRMMHANLCCWPMWLSAVA